MRKEIEYCMNPTVKSLIIVAAVIVIISFFLPWGGIYAVGHGSGWTIIKKLVEEISKSGFEDITPELFIVILAILANILLPLIASILILIKVIGAPQKDTPKSIKPYIQVTAIVPLALWVVTMLYIGIKLGDIKMFFEILKELIALGIITTAGGLIATIIMAPMLLMEKATPDTKICPMCAEEVKAAARICRFCGHKFEFQEGMTDPIEKVKDERNIERLLKTLNESDDIAIRAVALDDLARSDYEDLRSVLHKTIEDNAYRVRNLAISILSNILNEEDKEAILHAYENEEDGTLKKRLKKMLKKIGEEI